MDLIEAKRQVLTCPGETIQEAIDSIGMSQVELAERMGRSEAKLNELIKGKAPITTDTAIKLSRIIGSSVEFWLNKEARYQAELAEIKELEQQENHFDWLKEFSIPELKKLKILPVTSDKHRLVDALLKFFRVASDKEWRAIYNEVSVSFKIALKYTNEPGPISVWLRLGEIEADKLSLSPYDKSKMRGMLPRIKELSYSHPESWRLDLQKICAACGVAIAYTPMIKKAPISGAARWIKNGQVPLIQISPRYKTNHAFWFHFYHELAHILLHGSKGIYLKDDMKSLDQIEDDPVKEDEANNWAMKQLIPLSKRNELSKTVNISRDEIIALSKEWQIHPGVLVGHLARENDQLYKVRELMSLQVKVDF